jgi:hypothetical protein
VLREDECPGRDCPCGHDIWFVLWGVYSPGAVSTRRPEVSGRGTAAWVAIGLMRLVAAVEGGAGA